MDKDKLRPYQREGIEFIKDNPSITIPEGLGKTINGWNYPDKPSQ